MKTSSRNIKFIIFDKFNANISVVAKTTDPVDSIK